MRRMETVVHARGEPQRDVGAAAIGLDEGRIGQEVVQRVGKALGLQELGALDRAAGADDGVARTCEHAGIGIDRTCAGLQRPREAGMQAFKGLLPGIGPTLALPPASVWMLLMGSLL